MDNGNFFGRIVEYIGGLVKGNAGGGSGLSGLRLPESVTRLEFDEVIALLKKFLCSGEAQSASVEARNHLSAAILEAERSGFQDGWAKLKTLIGDARAREIVQPLLAFVFKRQDEFSTALRIFVGG
ncbi:MAG: hypothetical protein LBS11_09890 [Oscillospiraceae bacterium]|jgi:hypothetical protein|nr:hypothetical protein [Oscillospiraceae bacterium]